MSPSPLLQVRGLRTYFWTESGVAKAVDGVDLDLMPGEVLGLVGESGSGKTVTALSILRLVPDPPGRTVAGEIHFKGRDLLKLSWDEIRKVRGSQISMIFQEPMTSLNPVFKIGMQVMEIILTHEPVSKAQAHARAVEMLSLVGIPDAEARMNQYPHELSGGMRQRVMIAIALVGPLPPARQPACLAPTRSSISRTCTSGSPCLAASFRGRRPRCARWTAYRSLSTAARRSGWSASQVAARPLSGGPSSTSCGP